MTTPTATTSRQATSFGHLPRVNLLPPEIEQHRRLRRVQLGLGATVAAAVAVVGGLWLMANSSVNAAADDLAAEQRTTSQLRRDVGRYAEVPRVYAQVSADEALLTQAMGKEVRWSYYLNDLSRAMPPNVWLSSITIQQRDDGTAAAAASPGAAPGANDVAAAAQLGDVTFQGVAFQHNDVAAWLERLAKQKGFADASFSTSAQAYLGQRKIVNFTSSVKVTQQALSGRYAKPAGG